MSAGESLLSLLRKRIRRSGRISFKSFMAAALYEPGLGRYATAGAPMGAGGDYITSPEVDRAFGMLAARSVSEMAERLAPASPGERFWIIEAGPGRGTLCRDLLDGLGREDPDLFRRAGYVLVETSLSLREEQKRTLRGSAGEEKVVWRSWDDLQSAAPVKGCIIANEFLDALPVHLVEWSGGRLQEVYVTLGDEERLVETLDDPESPAVGAYFDSLGISLSEGQRAEVNTEAIDWIRGAASILDAGFCLIIDYGHDAEELYSSRHYAGTLLGYRKHQLVVDPLAAPGEHDLTSHVDFTSLREAAAASGFQEQATTSQRNFLVSLGLAEEIAALATASDETSEKEKLSRRFALHSLMSPAGMGGVFKVLLLARNASLSGMRSMADPFRGSVEARDDDV